MKEKKEEPMYASLPLVELIYDPEDLVKTLGLKSKCRVAGVHQNDQDKIVLTIVIDDGKKEDYWA